MCGLLVQTLILTEQLPVTGRQSVNSLARRGPAGRKRWASWGPEEGHAWAGCAGGQGTFFRYQGGRGLFDGKVAPPFWAPLDWPGIRGGVQR